MSPKNANTNSKLLKLKYDNTSTPNYWMLVSAESVSIAKQKRGQNREQIVNISRKAFEKFIKFYQAEQL